MPNCDSTGATSGFHSRNLTTGNDATHLKSRSLVLVGYFTFFFFVTFRLILPSTGPPTCTGPQAMLGCLQRPSNNTLPSSLKFFPANHQLLLFFLLFISIFPPFSRFLSRDFFFFFAFKNSDRHLCLCFFLRSLKMADIFSGILPPRSKIKRNPNIFFLFSAFLVQLEQQPTPAVDLRPVEIFEFVKEISARQGFLPCSTRL